MLKLASVIAVCVLGVGTRAVAYGQVGQGPLAAEAWRVEAVDSPERAPLAAYLDTLERASNLDELQRIPPRWNPTIHVYPKTTGILRLGFHQLREAQLSNSITDFERALDTFERARIEAPKRAETWYALGLTNIDMRRREFPDRRITQQHMSGYTRYYLGGREALLRSLALEPDFRPSLELLLEIVVEEADRQQPGPVIEAMVTAAGSMPDDPRPLLVLGRNARREQHLEDAEDWFRQYESVGGDPGVAGLETSRTLVGLDHVEDGVASYWSGLEAPGRRGRALYRTDLSWVAIQSEIDEFDRVETDSLAGWVAEFWARRDAEAIRPSGERLVEHMRRWLVVHRQFRVSRPEARATFNPPWLFEPPLPCTDNRDPSLDGVDFLNPSRPKDLRAWEPFLDNRAPVYMRHGEPIRRVWSNGNALGRFDQFAAEFVPIGVAGENLERAGEPAPLDNPIAGARRWEVWAYWIDGEPRIFSFTGTRALGFDAPSTLVFKTPTVGSAWYWYAVSLLADYVGSFRSDARRDMARSRHDAQVRAAGMPRAAPSSRCTRSYQRWIERTGSDMELVAHTDGYVLFFPTNLFPTVITYGLPGIATSTEGTILVVYSTPLSDLKLDDPPDSPGSVALRFRVSAIDSASGRQLWMDTTRQYRIPQQIQANSALSGYLEVKAPPGSYSVRVAVQLADSSAGNAVEWPDPVSIWLPGSQLELSDLITGGSKDNLLYWFGQEPVPLYPLDTFRPNTNVELFYVQGGMRPGETYRTTLRLTESDGDEELLSISFEEPAQREVESKRRAIVLQNLSERTYLLTITVQELGTNRTVRRTRTLDIGSPN